MQYSIASEIFGMPWHLSVQGLQQYMPVVRGMMNGAMIVEEAEPKDNIPFAISANTLKPTATPLSWSDDDDDMDEEEEGNEPTYEKVVHVLPVRGVMMKNDMMCGPRGTRTLGQRLLNADRDKSVIGHVMIIEGPGGASNAVAELTDAIKECKKPVIVWVDGLMCSAHMYVGAFAKERIASRASDVIGCIGTMIVYSGRIAKSDENAMNVREVTIYADEAYEKNEEYEKAINDFDFKPVKERLLNPHNEQFINDMKAQLPGVEDLHLHGRTFPAGEVVGSLVDRIGSFDDAVNRVVELSQYKKEETPASNSGQANNNQSIVSMNFPKLQLVLGLTSFEVESDGRRTFTVEEMQALEDYLAGADTTGLQSQLEQAQSDLQSAQQTTTEQQQLVTERDQTIASLRGEIATLKAGPAEQAAVAVVTADTEGEQKPGPVSAKFEDFGAQLEAVSKEYLGKTI